MELVLDRITVNPKVMKGRPCVRGMRITVESVAGMVADGMTVGEILEEYPSLQEADIRQCLQHEAMLAKN